MRSSVGKYFPNKYMKVEFGQIHPQELTSIHYLSPSSIFRNFAKECREYMLFTRETAEDRQTIPDVSTIDESNEVVKKVMRRHYQLDKFLKGAPLSQQRYLNDNYRTSFITSISPYVQSRLNSNSQNDRSCSAYRYPNQLKFI